MKQDCLIGAIKNLWYQDVMSSFVGSIYKTAKMSNQQILTEKNIGTHSMAKYDLIFLI